MARWHLRYGKWWAFQWSYAGWLSLGVHLDPRRGVAKGGRRFGPYMDLHFGPFILSLGRLPAYTHPDTYRAVCARGGLDPEEPHNRKGI